jgi:hypothetical protein
VRTLAAVLSGVALVAAGCGGGGTNAQDVLKQTASTIGAIHSGTLGLKLLVTPQGEGQPFGFELHGPFKFRQGSLPVTQMTYTQIANGATATATLVSNGTDAHVEAGGKQLALSAAQTDSLRQATAQIRGSGSGARLAISSWVENPKASDGGLVSGAKTDKVAGTIDLGEAATALVDVERLSGRDVRQLTSDERKRLQEAVRSSSFVLYSGKDDHLLRKLVMSVDIGIDVPSDLKAALGPLVGAKVDFELTVANPKT